MLLENYQLQLPSNIFCYSFHVLNKYNIYFFFSQTGKIRFITKTYNLFFCSVKNRFLRFIPVTKNFLKNETFLFKCLCRTHIAVFTKLFRDLTNRVKIFLDMRGLGYRFSFLNKRILFFYWGFISPIKFIIPKNVLISTLDNTYKILVIESNESFLAMRTAFLILRLRKFNVYTLKGICFLNQNISQKLNKKTMAKK